MKEEVYVGFEDLKTGKIVLMEESIEYMLKEIKLVEKEVNLEELPKEIVEFLEEMRDWYFSGNWLKRVVKESEL